MKRFFATLRCEVMLQWRNGFFMVVFIIMAVWLVLYTQAGSFDLKPMLPGLLAGNLTITTFYFMAALVLLEKAEGTLQARMITPLKNLEVLLARVVVLSALTLLENLLVAALFAGVNLALLPLALGLAVEAMIFSLAGFLVVVRYETINAFILPSFLFTLLLGLPVFTFFGLMESPLMHLHPVMPSLLLMNAINLPLTALQWLYSLLYPLVFIIGLLWCSNRAYHRLVKGMKGV